MGRAGSVMKKPEARGGGPGRRDGMGSGTPCTQANTRPDTHVDNPPRISVSVDVVYMSMRECAVFLY